MSVFKCKTCGAPLNIPEGATVVECDHCFVKQTLPRLDDDRRANLYDRANHFRRNNEYDKAMSIYEQILNEDKTDAEAYWSIVLCHYGIEYVEDPTTHKRLPTVNRMQSISVFDDDNYKSALKYAAGMQKEVYESEAKAINDIQKEFLTISQNEEPYDIFICYKESDNNGRRTPDSVLAQELYYQLKQEGFKVFFARISLEDKLGSAYEPHIFAALNSARVMVALGTKAEYLDAVWVKNEWSRFLALIKQGKKKVLIPAYKDMDPYDLPEAFSHLQAQDMSKLGFMQDLIRGIKKILDGASKPATKVVVTAQETVNTNGVEPLLKRVFMFLEDGNIASANEYCERVLDIDPECARAYLAKLMARFGIRKIDGLSNLNDYNAFVNDEDYKKAVRFADDKLKETLEHIVDRVRTNSNEREKAQKYAAAEKKVASAEEWIEKAQYRGESGKVNAANKGIAAYKEAIRMFESLGDYRDAARLVKKYEKVAEELVELPEIMRKDAILEEANRVLTTYYSDLSECERDFRGIRTSLRSISGYKNADELLKLSDEREAKQIASIKKGNNKRLLKSLIYIIPGAAIIIFAAVCAFISTFITPKEKYKEAVECMDNGYYYRAYSQFNYLEDKDYIDEIKDSAEKAAECKSKLEELYPKSKEQLRSDNYKDKIAGYSFLLKNSQYRNCESLLETYKSDINAIYNEALALKDSGDIETAYEYFSALREIDWEQSAQYADECNSKLG